MNQLIVNTLKDKIVSLRQEIRTRELQLKDYVLDEPETEVLKKALYKKHCMLDNLVFACKNEEEKLLAMRND